MDRCLTTAKNSGVPKDQAQQLLNCGITPFPWQWKFHAVAREADKPDGPTEIGVGGARGPGKSFAIFAQSSLDDCQRVAGLKVLFLRKTAVSAKESFGDLIEKVLIGSTKYEIANNIISFPNHSRIILGGFHNENDIDKYVGIEYDLIVVEELNQLTLDKYQKLKGSLRTSKTNWRPRIYASFNPGGLGHSFVKERFVLPMRLREETTTRFVSSTYKANPFLNKEYIDYLESLEGDLGRAWREGDFDLFAGQFFKEFRYDIHVCEPFTIPDEWKRIVSLDYGFNHEASLAWYAVDEDGVLYRYRELVRAGMSYTQFAEEYVSMTSPNEVIDYIVADPAFWAKKGERDDLLSGAEVFAGRVKEMTKKEIQLIKADNNRIIGWSVVREYLRPYQKEGKITAKLQIFSTCVKLINAIPEQQHDDKKPEDMLKKDGDDTLDELRYAIMSEPKPRLPQENYGLYEYEQRYSTIGV